MKTVLSSDTMDIPEGVTIKINAKIIEVEGPRGKLTKNFKHLNLDFQLITDEATGKLKLKIDSWFGSRKTTAAIRTALSHVQNLITGVTKGYRYKMRMVYAHFPINASIAGTSKSIEIRNFLGEKKGFGSSFFHLPDLRFIASAIPIATTKRLIPLLNRVLVEKIVPPAKTSAGNLLPEKTSKHVIVANLLEPA